jgi:hypothetical protein
MTVPVTPITALRRLCNDTGKTISRRAILLCWLPPLGALGQQATRKGSMEGEQLIRAWLDAVDRVSPNDYRPIGSFDEFPDAVRGDSEMWCERFFAPQANPRLQSVPPALTYHLSTDASPDLVRHVYAVQKLALDVVESINFTLIRTNRRSPLVAQDVHEVASSVLNLKDPEHEWTFHIPASLSDGTWFSTDADADPFAMSSWADRADGGIRKDILVFLCFKKDPDLVGYRDIRQWFDGAFRSRPTTR